MAKIICIMGESGSGKTTSLRNLDEKSTVYIDCDKKGLPFKNWKEKYNAEKKNYFKISDRKNIMTILKKINDSEKKQIKTIVIDTINAIMIDDEMSRAKEKGFDKWVEIASSIWDIIAYIKTMNDDINCIVVAHSQTEIYENGYMFTRIKVSGKKLEKIVLESQFNSVLLAKVKNGKHIFETKARDSTAKTPMDAIEKFEIENDINIVIEKLKDY